MKSEIAHRVQEDIEQGCALPCYQMWPELNREYNETDYDLIFIEDNCILVNGKKYKPFNLSDENDVKRLAGAWIVDAFIYREGNPDRTMIIGINDGLVQIGKDLACESPCNFRSNVWPVELVTDFVFADTGEPVGKLVEIEG